MVPMIDEYLDLATQLKAYIHQEFPSQNWLMANREDYLYYREYALSKNKSQEPTKTVKIVIPEISKPIVPDKIAVAPNIKKAEPVAPIIPPVSTKKEISIEKTSQAVSKGIQLDQMKAPPLEDFSDVNKIIVEKFPEQTILLNPPSDALARDIKNAWKTKPARSELALVVGPLKPGHQNLLDNILKALKICFNTHAKVYQRNSFNKQITEMFLDLPDLDILLNQPEKKAILWSQIVDKIGKPQI